MREASSVKGDVPIDMQGIGARPGWEMHMTYAMYLYTAKAPAADVLRPLQLTQTSWDK